MSILDQKRIVETGVWVEHKFEAYHEHGQTILESKHFGCLAVIWSQRVKFLSNIFDPLKIFNCKPVFQKMGK